jgi:F-type H+-transporting ATPase subunit delta
MRGYVDALVAEVVRDEEGAVIAADLNAVAHLVSRTNELAVVLTDFGVPVGARRAVLSDLLTSRVHPTALRLVLRAIDKERADELPTVLHELFEYVHHLHDLGPEEVRAEEPVAGRGAWRAFASGYADAVLEDVAATAELEEIEDELFRFARIVESTPSLSRALSDPARPVEERQHLVSELLDRRARPATVRLARLAVQGHIRDAATALDWLVVWVAQARGWRVARVHTALPIDPDEQRQMAEVLQRLTNQPVELQIIEEADLLGGAVVELGDLLVDGSARHRLEQLREHLFRPARATQGAQS